MKKRLDLLLVEKFLISRNYAEFLIENGKVFVNKKLMKKKHQKFTIENMIEINKNSSHLPKITYLKVTDDFLIVNKPAGISCHKSSTTHRDEVVLNELVIKDYSLSDALAKEEFGLPHRIDKDTEGIILMSRTSKFYEYAISAFADGEIKKTYLCVVKFDQNLKDKDILKLNLSYGKDKVIVKSDGIESITSYEVVAKYKQYAVLKIHPLTGRRHQIRVVLAHQGWPIVGDKLYGGENFDRLCLFASELSSDAFNASLYSDHIHTINNLLMALIF